MTGVDRRGFLAAAMLGGTTLAAGTATASADEHPSRGLPHACDPSFGPATFAADDARYDSVRTGHNTRFAGDPEYVSVLDEPGQVVDAVGKAVADGKRIAVRGGGHCLENFTTTADLDVLLDLSEMDQVYYDQERHAFAVEGGATLGQVYTTLFKGWGVTLPGGSCPSVGIGGHLAGGGYGFLSRRHGLAADHLYAVEVVVVDSSGRPRRRVATREPGDPNRDLWWAHTGGGGGNFGVVTRYWLRTPGVRTADPAGLLPKAPRAMRRRIRMWSWDSMSESVFTRLVRNYCSWFEHNSAPGSPATKLWGSMFASHRSAGTLGVIAGVDDGEPDAERLLDTHLGAVSSGVGEPPVVDVSEVRPWLDQGNWVNEPAGRAKNKNADLRRGFTEGQIAALYRHLASESYANPDALLSLTGYGGEINRVAPDATATPTRDAVLRAYFTAGSWSADADDSRHLTWIREMYRDIYADTGGVPVPNEVNAGAYINYPDVDLADPAWNTSGAPWHALYYKDNYPRLQRIKKRYDPRDVFRHALSIELPN